MPTSANVLDTLATDCHAAFLEFIGTTLFLMMAFGGIQAGTAAAESAGSSEGPSVDLLLYIALSMGFSLLFSAWLFFRVTGSIFNPNVSLALFLCGILRPVRFVLYSVAQLAGGIAAAAIVRGLTSAPLASNTTLSGRTSSAQGVFIEMFITAALILSVLMLAAEKHHATPVAPVGIGLTLFSGHLFAVYYTGAAMNTARSFGPAVVSGFPDVHHWVYWVGPCLGSILASLIYGLLKQYDYGSVNPGQDSIDPSKSPADPITEFKTIFARRSSSPYAWQRSMRPVQPNSKAVVSQPVAEYAARAHEDEKGVDDIV